jgi:hypothetical protein
MLMTNTLGYFIFSAFVQQSSKIDCLCEHFTLLVRHTPLQRSGTSRGESSVGNFAFQKEISLPYCQRGINGKRLFKRLMPCSRRTWHFHFPIVVHPVMQSTLCAAAAAVCGNGIKEKGEQCDPPKRGKCNHKCQKIKKTKKMKKCKCKH